MENIGNEKVIVEAVAVDKAYETVITFIINNFEANTLVEKGFKEKTYKGKRILDIRDFIESKIQEANQNISALESFNGISFESITHFFKMQRECYCDISVLSEKILLKNKWDDYHLDDMIDVSIKKMLIDYKATGN